VEIGQYLRDRPRTAVIALLLLPLVAGLAAFLILRAQPAEYTGRATVSVPSRTQDSASGIGIFVADFGQRARSQVVTDEVSKATGVPQEELRTIEVVRLGVGSLFEVSYTGDGRQQVEAVLRTTIANTYTRMVGAGTAEAEANLARAREQYTAAVAARQKFENDIGSLQPERDYSDLSSKIRSLQANGGSPVVIRQLSAQRDALVPQVRRAEELTRGVDTAEELVEQARQTLLQAQGEAAEAADPSIVQELAITEGSATGGLVQGVGVAMVAGLLAGLALLLLPELFRRRTPSAPLAPPTVLPGARDVG
jgi:hypothetical protein